MDTPQWARGQPHSDYTDLTSALTSSQQIVHTEPYLPIFCGHGRNDAEIPTYYSEEAMAFLRDVLRLPSAFLTFRRYEGLGHAVNNAEMCDAVIWLQSVLRLQPVARGG
jgi:predicted esterase